MYSWYAASTEKKKMHPRFFEIEAVNKSTEVTGAATQLCLSPSFV